MTNDPVAKAGQELSDGTSAATPRTECFPVVHLLNPSTVLPQRNTKRRHHRLCDSPAALEG